jgi:NADPH:quinone reductase
MPEPVIDAPQTLVKVVAVAVDPIDTYIRRNAFPMNLSFPFIIGRDMVGTVEVVGGDVRRFSVGDRVWCNNQGYHGRQGTFAEYLAIDERFLYPLPDGVDEKEAVAVVHSATTAAIGLLREAEGGRWRISLHKRRCGQCRFCRALIGN